MLKRHNPNLTPKLNHLTIVWNEAGAPKKLKRIGAILKELQQLKKQLSLLLK